MFSDAKDRAELKGLFDALKAQMEGLVVDTATDPVPDSITFNGKRVGMRIEMFGLYPIDDEEE